MQMDEALRRVEVLHSTRSAVDVIGVQYDSRRVRPGDVFVAMRGGSVDGNLFLAEAIGRGANAIVTDSREAWDARPDGSVPFYLVEHGRRALAGIAANLLDHPERKLKISAVTGTNGKTTTAWLLEQMLRSVGRRCVLVGTIETHVGEEVRASEHTTPEASDLLQTFADGVAAGCTEAVMEMSSHALDQERVWGVPVDVAMFTNLTQDHLDYHGTMEAYAAAKLKLFRGVGANAPRVGVVNVDDAFGERLIEIAFEEGSDCLTYGLERRSGEMKKEATTEQTQISSRKDNKRGSAFFISSAENVRYEAGRTRFLWRVRGQQVEMESPLSGRVNVYNLLAASGAALARGLTLEQVADAARTLQQVPGRFQAVAHKLGFTVVVDYAHTDDALRNLIALARELVGAGRVITLFGCGGDRDQRKRPKMGRAAGEGSDLVVLTSDNPRSEDPSSIVAGALVGLRETGVEYVVEEDRAKAIGVALRAARVGDVVLIAGKGHEKVQILREGTVPFDDAEVASAVLREMR